MNQANTARLHANRRQFDQHIHLGFIAHVLSQTAPVAASVVVASLIAVILMNVGLASLAGPATLLACFIVPIWMMSDRRVCRVVELYTGDIVLRTVEFYHTARYKLNNLFKRKTNYAIA